MTTEQLINSSDGEWFVFHFTLCELFVHFEPSVAVTWVVEVFIQVQRRDLSDLFIQPSKHVLSYCQMVDPWVCFLPNLMR
jgi:hypothetical protein